MKDAIAKLKGPCYSTSRNWQKAYKHNTVKARRQAGRIECLDIDEEPEAQEKPVVVEPCEDFRIVVYTQFYENYGAHAWDGQGECPQYWKAKGGFEYVVPLTTKQVANLGASGLRELAEEAMRHPDVCYRNNSAEEYPIDWELLAPGEFTSEEKQAIDWASDEWMPYRYTPSTRLLI